MYIRLQYKCGSAMDDENMAKYDDNAKRQYKIKRLHKIFLRHSGSQLKHSQNIQLAYMYMSIYVWRFAYTRYRYAGRRIHINMYRLMIKRLMMICWIYIISLMRCDMNTTAHWNLLIYYTPNDMQIWWSKRTQHTMQTRKKH